MTVKYNKNFGLILCFMAGIVLILHIYLFSLTGKIGAGFYSAIIILTLGIAYTKNKYFIVTHNELSVYNAFGLRVKKYTFNTLSDIYEEKLKFYFNNKSGVKIRIRISKFMSDASDWNKFISYINQSNMSQELHDI